MTPRASKVPSTWARASASPESTVETGLLIAGDRKQVFAAANQAASLAGGNADSGHLPSAGGFEHQPVAVKDHPDRIFEAEYAGGIGRRYLAHAVTDHGLRQTPHERQSAVRPTCSGKDRRLCKLVIGCSGLFTAREHFAQRPLGEARQDRVAVVKGFAKRGLAVVQLFADAEPLRPLA